MHKSNFPNLETLETKISQRCQASDLYALIEKSISLLIAKTLDDYSNEEKNFLKEQLCKMITRTIKYDHKSSLNNSIIKLFLEVINLSISTKLNPYAIQALTPFFDIDSHKPDIFPIKTEMLDNVYDFTNSSINSEMIMFKSKIPSLDSKLLKTFFDKSIFDIILSMINSDEINIQQIGSIMNFFRKIQFFLNERLSLSLCIFFAKYSLKLLSVDQYGAEGVSIILSFFKTFMNHLLYFQEDIFHLTIDMLRFQNQNQYKALKLFLLIIYDSQLPRNQKLIKKTLISLLQQTSNPKIFIKIYDSLSILVREISFTANDLNDFTCNIRKFPNDANTIILNLRHIISSPYLKPANNILLGLHLINCTDDDGISGLILADIIKNFDKKCNLTQSNFKLTDKIVNLIILNLNSNHEKINLINLGYFISNFPRTEMIHEYIMKITEEEDFECYSTILRRIANSSSQFESEKFLSSFAQNVIEQLTPRSDRKVTPRIIRLTEVIVCWIQYFSSVPENQIINKLMNIDYYKCPDEIPSVVSAIISRTSNRRLIRQLVNKIMKDTVPEKHANWAINMAFDVIHDEKRDIERIAEILFQLLSESPKKSNAIYMIYQAVLYEADFYNIGKVNISNGIKIESLLNKQPFTFTVHPLHSARRIYTEVGKFLQKRLINFTLYIKGKEILLDQPLSSIPFKLDSNKKMKITVKLGENDNRNVYCRLHLQPFFIDYIQRTEIFTALFNLMNNFNTESEILFLMLNLIDNNTIKPVLSSPIQQIFKNDYFMPFVDIDSFRLFPFVLDAALRRKAVYSSAYLSSVFQRLNGQYLDQVSLLMSCRLLSTCAADSCHFNISLIRNCLILNDKKHIREAMANILTKTDETDKLLTLLSSTAQISYRNKTKQFFSLLKNKEIDHFYIEPLFKLITQYETDLEGEIDETINGILSIYTEPTEETFNLVFNFLLSPPTVCSRYLPFLHTLKSRKNAYKFILKYDKCIDKLNSILSLVPMSNINKLSDNFSYYKRGFLSPLKLNTSLYIALHSIEAIRNYVIRTKFDKQFLNDLSKLFLEMTFTCLPTIDINEYNSLKYNGTIDSLLNNILNGIFHDQGLNKSLFDLIHITCHPEKKINFIEQYEKVFKNKTKKIIFFVINNPRHLKFKFPLFYDDFILKTVSVKSDDDDYSVIYRDREINSVNNLLSTDNAYLFNNYSKPAWFIAENNELSKYDISELPDRCFGGKKKRQSAFLLIYEDKSIDVPKIRIDRKRQEEIDQKNATFWPSIVCNSSGFINFARELFEKDVDRYLDFGFDAFFKIAIVDDESLKDWKELLISKVLIDEKKSSIFLNHFVSNKYLIEKVNLSKSGTFILPELFSFAKSKYNVDFNFASKLVELFENSSTVEQFGFVCDVLTALLPDSHLSHKAYLRLLNMLTEILNRVESVYAIIGRILNCFDALMSCVSPFVDSQDNSIIECIIGLDFLEKWFEIAKKSASFKAILESVLSNNSEKVADEVSPLINRMLEEAETVRHALMDSDSNEQSGHILSEVKTEAGVVNEISGKVQSSISERVNNDESSKSNGLNENEQTDNGGRIESENESLNDQGSRYAGENENEESENEVIHNEGGNEESENEIGNAQNDVKNEESENEGIRDDNHSDDENMHDNRSDNEESDNSHNGNRSDDENMHDNRSDNEESENESIQSIVNENMHDGGQSDHGGSGSDDQEESENEELGQDNGNERGPTNAHDGALNESDSMSYEEDEEEETQNESYSDNDQSVPPSIIQYAQQDMAAAPANSANHPAIVFTYNDPSMSTSGINGNGIDSSINSSGINGNVIHTSGINSGTGDVYNAEYDYSSYEEEEEEDINESSSASNNSASDSFIQRGLFSHASNGGLSNNDNSSDFIVLSNSNSENNLSRDSNAGFIELSFSNEDLSGSDNKKGDARNNKSKRSRNSNQLSFDFDMKTNSSDGSTE